MRRSLLFAAFFLLGAAALWAAQSTGFVNLEARAKRGLVTRLMEVTDLRTALDCSINGMVAALPQEIRSDVRGAIDTGELLKRLMPVYERHLDRETLEALLAFYETEAGKQWLRAQGPIMEDSMAISKIYTQECVQRLKAGK